MNYQELIKTVLERLELDELQIANISINFPTQTITIIDTSFRKMVMGFPDPAPDPFEFLEPEPKSKRVKAVKKVG